MNNEIEYICQKCDKNFYKSNEEKEIKCPFCNAKDTFMSVSQKDFENIMDVENLKITCDNCLANFSGEQLITNDCKCPNCNKKYNEDYVYNLIKKIEKRYACNTCNCKFSTEVFFAYSGSCPNCHDKLMTIEQWEDYKAVELDGEIPDEDWANI